MPERREARDIYSLVEFTVALGEPVFICNFQCYKHLACSVRIDLASLAEHRKRLGIQHSAMNIIKVILALALVGVLFVAGWSVYRRLPADRLDASNIESTYGSATTPLKIVLSSGLSEATLISPVELYPFDLAAVEREFQASPQLGKRFDEFLARRMRGVTPVKAQIDGRDRAAAILSQGNWWLRARASFASGETVEWRLPVNVAGRELTIELTTENAYERTKEF